MKNVSNEKQTYVEQFWRDVKINFNILKRTNVYCEQLEAVLETIVMANNLKCRRYHFRSSERRNEVHLEQILVVLYEGRYEKYEQDRKFDNRTVIFDPGCVQQISTGNNDAK